MDAEPSDRTHARPELQAGGRPAATPLDGFCGLLAQTAAKYASGGAEPTAEAGIEAEAADPERSA